MAVLNVRFSSESLQESTSMTVILPESSAGQIGLDSVASVGKPQVLYLLHGLSDDDSGWLRRTAIERYVSPLGLAVVMPKAGRSFYANEHVGQRYWDFISQELPAVVSRMFNVSAAREDTFVAGLSMGGYGAFKLALNFPERFAAAASLSGALNVSGSESMDRLRAELPQVWSEAGPAGTTDDLIHLLGTVDPSAVPALFQVCGTEDFLFEDNVQFAAAAQNAGIAVDSDLTGPGDHTWDYWDAQIRKAIEWLPVRGRAKF